MRVVNPLQAVDSPDENLQDLRSVSAFSIEMGRFLTILKPRAIC